MSSRTDNCVMVVEDTTSKHATSKHATLMAIGMIAGLGETYLPSGYGAPRIPKAKPAHIPHTGNKERERRMKRLLVAREEKPQ